jgi:cell division protein FtsZ
MNTIKRYAADDAHVIYGAAYDESLGDQMRVTVIATGLNPGKRQQAPLSVVQAVPVVQRTGTDNLPVITSVDAQTPPETNYSGLGVPSVWRKREASARVEALANNGMDEIEIPAFLRRQAD